MNEKIPILSLIRLKLSERIFMCFLTLIFSLGAGALYVPKASADDYSRAQCREYKNRIKAIDREMSSIGKQMMKKRENEVEIENEPTYGVDQFKDTQKRRIAILESQYEDLRAKHGVLSNERWRRIEIATNRGCNTSRW